MLLLPIFLLFCNLSMCSISLFPRFCSRLKSKLFFLIEGFRTISEDNTKTCDIYLVCWPLSAECIIYSPWCLINSILFSDNFNYGEHNFFFYLNTIMQCTCFFRCVNIFHKWHLVVWRSSIYTGTRKLASFFFVPGNSTLNRVFSSLFIMFHVSGWLPSWFEFYHDQVKNDNIM